MKNLILASLLVILCGCATAVRGTTGKVTINYTPADANVTTSLGHTCKQSPCVLTIPRKEPFIVTAMKHGFVTQTVNVVPKPSAKGVGATAGNIIVGGVVGVVVDASTGANMDHKPNPVNIDLVPATQ